MTKTLSFHFKLNPAAEAPDTHLRFRENVGGLTKWSLCDLSTSTGEADSAQYYLPGTKLMAVGRHTEQDAMQDTLFHLAAIIRTLDVNCEYVALPMDDRSFFDPSHYAKAVHLTMPSDEMLNEYATDIPDGGHLDVTLAGAFALVLPPIIL